MSSERRDNFIKDFEDLLSKYDAEIYPRDDYHGWPGCGSDIRIVIEFPDVSGDDPNRRFEHVPEIDLGVWLGAEKVQGLGGDKK